VVNSPLATLDNTRASLYWAFVFLLPALMLPAIDTARSLPKILWQTRPKPSDRRVFRAAWLSALFVTVLFTGVAALTNGSVAPWLVAAAWSSQSAVFLLFFACVTVISGIAATTFYPARTEFFLLELLGSIFLFLYFTGKILPAVSFDGPEAVLYAIALSLTTMGTFTGLSLAIATGDSAPVDSGLDLVLEPVVFPLEGNTIGISVALALLVIVGIALARAAAGFDWNYVLQETVVVAVWVSAFALFYAMHLKLRRRLGILYELSFAVISIVALRLIPVQPADAERYAGVNISFRLARDVLSPPTADRSFYNLLNQSSNIGRSVNIKPVEYQIVPNFKPIPGPRPNIFVIVVDSLRKDYLSPYNPKVTFTPAIDAFARESAVMKNAFTHYGGTGLSEPSIWAGGMLVHKQYVVPFAPMNALNKLVNADGYQSFVTMDNVLDTVVPAAPSLTELDAGRFTMNLDLCNSLDELESKIGPNTLGQSKPIFAYTQPQNLHIAAIQREGRSVPEGESYPGFNAPYASRLKRIDACFGKFINTLKAKNLYDSSIVILTSDHGDSLGEDGRFGHTFTLFPEIVRVPLIFHLPKELNSKVVYSADTPAFTTDITPSLYYLLGHTAVVSDPVFGRPLFTYAATQQETYNRADYLIAASDAAVYALVMGNGRDDKGQKLYIADAVNEEDYLYDLNTGNQESLTPKIRTAARKGIAKLIEAINARFAYTPQK
jgi:hypothetical protein